MPIQNADLTPAETPDGVETQPAIVSKGPLLRAVITAEGKIGVAAAQTLANRLTAIADLIGDDPDLDLVTAADLVLGIEANDELEQQWAETMPAATAALTANAAAGAMDDEATGRRDAALDELAEARQLNVAANTLRGE